MEIRKPAVSLAFEEQQQPMQIKKQRLWYSLNFYKIKERVLPAYAMSSPQGDADPFGSHIAASHSSPDPLLNTVCSLSYGHS